MAPYAFVNPLKFLQDIVKTSSKVISWGAALQKKPRQELTKQLQGICSRTETAYVNLLPKLNQLKKEYGNPDRLAKAANKFASSPNIRLSFKPDHLCGEVDQLLQRLSSNLDPLKYSVAIGQIENLRTTLKTLRNYDNTFDEAFSVFRQDIDVPATRILTGNPTPKGKERSANEIKKAVNMMEKDMLATVKAVRVAKDRLHI